MDSETSQVQQDNRLSLKGLLFSRRTRDISLKGCSVTLGTEPDFKDGPLHLHLQDIGSMTARVARRTGPRDVGIEFLDVPKSTRTALFARIFLNPDNHCHHLEGPEKLYAACFKRMFGVIE